MLGIRDTVLNKTGKTLRRPYTTGNFGFRGFLCLHPLAQHLILLHPILDKEPDHFALPCDFPSYSPTQPFWSLTCLILAFKPPGSQTWGTLLLLLCRPAGGTSTRKLFCINLGCADCISKFGKENKELGNSRKYRPIC